MDFAVKDMQRVILPHNEIRLISLILETLKIKQELVPIGRGFPVFVICRRLEVNPPISHNMSPHFLLELLARPIFQTGHQLVLVVGNQEQVLRPAFLQVVALRRDASQHASRAVHERKLGAVETHFERWNDDRLLRNGQLRFGNAQNCFVQIAYRLCANQRQPAGKRSISVIR